MMSRTTQVAHRVSVAMMAVAVLVATLDGFVQSYSGLHRWALEQGLSGWKADSFPLLVDLFVIVGELGLFAIALEGHRLTRSGLSWLDLALPFGLASAGWGVSLAFNVGAVHGDWSKQVTAAVAPVASMLGLLVLLRTLHRLVTSGLLDAGTPKTAASSPLSGSAVVQAPALVPDVLDVPEPEDLQVRAARMFADDVTAGRVPGIRAIKQQLRIGQPKAREVRNFLAVLADPPLEGDAS